MRNFPKYKALALAVMGIIMGSCINDAATEPEPTPGRGENFYLTLTVMTGNSTTSRAADHTDDAEENGSAAENYIDFNGNDFSLVLFDSNGGYVHTLDVTDLWSFGADVSGNSIAYIIETEIEFPETITQATIDDIKAKGFQVLALANWKSTGTTATYESFATSKPTLSSLWTNGSNYNFGYPTAAGGMTWMPDMEALKLIPMFGMASGITFVPNPSAGRTEARATVPMQRALAKVEVIDNLQQDGIEVEDVYMTTFNDMGRLIPDCLKNPGWAEIGSQVSSSSLPGGVAQRNRLLFFHDASKKTWTAYIPEMNLGTSTVTDGTLPDARPHLEVSIKAEGIPNYTGATYQLHFAKYDADSKPTLPDDSWNYILRNHIYRFSINKVGVTTELHLHVIPWYEDDDEVWDFTDHVTIAKMLEWKEGTYDGPVSEEGRVLLWIDNNPEKILTGTFRIKSPVKGQWYARLTPLDDAKSSAITFVDEFGRVLEPSAGDPPVCHEVSGVIEQEDPVTIRIRPTVFENDDMSAFKLEFFVENLGMWMSVPMTPDEASYSTYTIVRPGNKLE